MGALQYAVGQINKGRGGEHAIGSGDKKDLATGKADNEQRTYDQIEKGENHGPKMGDVVHDDVH